jgi:uncharacterized repeat protein (TIGR03833 family)
LRTSKHATLQLKIGSSVEINPRSDRSRNVRVHGSVAEILTKADTHPHGIMVRLDTGEIGRVKTIHKPVSLIASAASEPLVINQNIKIYTLNDLVKNGENHSVEFKRDALWSTLFNADDIKSHKPQTTELHAYGRATSKFIIAKALAGFLNTDGGTLIIGIAENKEGGENIVVGIDLELKKLKDPCLDGYRRMLIDLIKNYLPSNIFNHINKYFSIDFEHTEEVTVCRVTVEKSDKRVFLKIKNKAHFYIRTDASTRELDGEETVEYCEEHF